MPEICQPPSTPLRTPCPPPIPRELVNERSVQPMADVVRGGTIIKFRIPEILYVVEAGDVVHRQIATLRGLAFTQCVIDVPRIPVGEPSSKRCLQAVVDHRLSAVHVVTAGRPDCRVGPQTGLSVEGLSKLTLQREIVAIGPDVADFCGHRAGEGALHTGH